MEDGLREILKSHYGEIMKDITEPQYLAPNIKVLTPIDLERIEAERKERGDSAGVFVLLNRLQKRGPQAFSQLIAALKKNKNQEIAVKLEKEAERMNLYRADKKPIARGPWPSERPVSPSVQQLSINQPRALGEEEMHSAKPTLPSTNIKIPNPEDLLHHEEVNPKQPKNKGKDTLLKDIPSHLKDRIVTKLNIDAALSKNWKGIAGAIKLTAEEQEEIGSSNSPMEELFKLMAYKEYHVINLIDMLLKIERHDVVREITDAGYYFLEEGKGEKTSHLSNEVEAGKDEDQELTDMTTIEEEVFLPAASLSRSPSQVSDQGSPDDLPTKKSATVKLPSTTQTSVSNSCDQTKQMDEKKGDAIGSTVGLPSATQTSVSNSGGQTKQMDEKKGDASDSTVLLSPTQVVGADSPKMLDEKKSNFSHEEENDNHEDPELTDNTAFDEVFSPDTINAKAIFISCEKYKNLNKLTQLTQQIKPLSRALEDRFAWEVACIKESKTMKTELDLKKSDVCFVYIAGHTLHINGENYLLPIDIDLNLVAADIMDLSLNINKLVKELSEKALMVIVIVDGGHFNEGQFECPIALTGLTPIIPPSNTVIAFPCQPGYIRPQEEMLSYIKALISVIMKEEDELTPTTLFANVKEALKDNISSPVEFSLSRSLLPIYLNASDQDKEGITIQTPTQDTPRRAIVFSDQTFEVFKKTVKTGTGHLETSLRQLGWEVEMCNNLKPEQIKRKLHQSLGKLEPDKMNVFMLYFMGYVTKDKHSIGKESRLANADAEPKISIQWLVNMMSQYVTGPKILIVDDPRLSVSHKLLASSELPQDVLLCLPNDVYQFYGREEKDSFTLLLAQNLAASPNTCLETVIKTSAKNWKYHHVDSNLFYC